MSSNLLRVFRYKNLWQLDQTELKNPLAFNDFTSPMLPVLTPDGSSAISFNGK